MVLKVLEDYEVESGQKLKKEENLFILQQEY